MRIARQVEFPKLFVFGNNPTWKPTPDEYKVIGELFTEYNEFCTHATQSYEKAWVNKDSNHIIFDVRFDRIVGDINGVNSAKYELIASILFESDEANDKFNCHFIINRYEMSAGFLLWKEGLAASSIAVGSIQVASGTRVEDAWAPK